MESLIHADIFFFISTVIFIFLSIIVTVILVYIAIILADIREISRIARTETADIAEDIREVRQEIKDKLKNSSSIIASLISIISGLFNQRKSRVIKSKKIIK